MNAMLEARIVAARTHGAAAGAQGLTQGVVRMIAVSE
jgi:hypothetical protein